MHGHFVLIFVLKYIIQSDAVNGIATPGTICNSTIRYNLGHALGSIIDRFFVPNSSDMMVSLHAKHKQSWRLMQDLLTCATPFMFNIKLHIENIDGPRLQTSARKYNLLLIDGPQALVELDPAKFTKEFDFSEHYLILLIDPDKSRAPNLLIATILNYFFSNYLINVSVLYESKPDYVEVYTYFPFLDNNSCKANNVRVINVYNGTWVKSLATNIFPNKLTNMQNCSLTVAVWDAPPYLSYYPNRSSYAQLGSFEGEMLIVLAKKLNFTMELVEPPNDEQRGRRLENGTLTGAMKMLHDHLADLSLGCFRYTVERCALLTGALPYYQTWQIFGVVLTTQFYSSLEIFTFPFDAETWFGLVFSFQLVLLLAYFIYQRSKDSPLAHIMIGYPRPRSPLISVYSLFLGIPIQRVPHTNFARFVLVMWVTYGYVMRNAYQSFLYQLLQTDLYRTPPQNIFELMKDGYSLVMTASTLNTVGSLPLLAKGRIPIILNNSTYEWKSYEMVEQMGGRLAGVSPRDYLTYYVMSKHRRGVFYVLPDRLFAQHITIYFPKHSYLTERFNFLLMQLRSQGLVDYWAEKYLDLSYYDLVAAEDNDALDMDDLGGLFIMYLTLVGLASLVFLVELLWHRWGRTKC
ncbi:uncharacterized protein LOC105219310 [Zeugodacus cucurbitae]|uniref:uncharacterized protein LOC105219310 n=1 Tax=Zeugodacus cucurbitae TaxID=28588 RepID=UPI0010A74413|nr:uncharacterized protein LOC105219310 [Zeugodacus cucurbitae]